MEKSPRLILTVLLASSFFQDVCSKDSAIIEQAQSLGLPLTETARDRVRGDVFGTSRGVRSSDVIVFNKSGKDFSLFNTFCSRGSWSIGLFPEHSLPAYSTSVYAAESNGFLGGVTCSAAYRNKDGSSLQIETDNPYIGSNGIDHWISSNLRISSTIGSGNNNQVRFVIEDK